MSDALYPTRLRWDGHVRIGVARHDGVSVELRRPPAIHGLDMASEIDFIPHVIAIVRTGCGAQRDMTPDEQHDALASLQAMAIGARDPLDGCATLVIAHR